jgi:phage-related protein
MAVRGTPQRVIRVDQETWDAYGEACASKGTTRADDLRRHMHAAIKDHQAEQRRIAAEERAAGT